ncbi:MAG: hypothetical protein VX181_18905, partial [Pseudomonadota bacterium]|nr:hypothetical protein [Pseudomonadota bacterium]
FLGSTTVRPDRVRVPSAASTAMSFARPSVCSPLFRLLAPALGAAFGLAMIHRMMLKSRVEA